MILHVPTLGKMKLQEARLAFFLISRPSGFSGTGGKKGEKRGAWKPRVELSLACWGRERRPYRRGRESRSSVWELCVGTVCVQARVVCQLRRMAGGGGCFWMQRTFQAFPARLCLRGPAGRGSQTRPGSLPRPTPRPYSPPHWQTQISMSVSLLPFCK